MGRNLGRRADISARSLIVAIGMQDLEQDGALPDIEYVRNILFLACSKSCISISLRHQILSKPDIPGRININTNSYTIEGRTGQVNAMPACRRFVDHALLNTVHPVISSGVWPGPTDAFAAIGIACKALIGDALAL